MAPSAHLAVFLAELHELPGPDAPEDTLDARLGELVAAGAAWPDIHLAADDFVRRVAVRIPAGEAPLRFLAQIRPADLYLACACEARIGAAIATFEARLLVPLRGYLRRTCDSPTTIDDAVQTLRAKLFGEGRISDYVGRGSLEGWVRVAAVHTLLDLIDKEKQVSPGDDATGDDLLIVDGDPDLEIIKGRYRPAFHDAFRSALASLDVEERNMMRLHVIDGLNIAEIGAIVHSHRATVARRIAAIREKILAATRLAFAERLSVPSDDVESMMGLLYSQLDQSLHRFLARSQPAQ